MTNTNSTNMKDSYSCDSCYSCYSCDSCNSCNYCYSCNSCNSCDSCNYCDSCDYCDSCYSCDYCYYSKGLRMSEKMLFCLGEGKYESKGDGYQKNYMVFNTKVSELEYSEIKNSLPYIKLPVTFWVGKDDMTDDEKENNSVYKTIGGYLRQLSYEDAWAKVWSEMSNIDKNKILSIPQFDSKIFKEITGIDTSKIDDATEQAIKLLKSNGYKIVKEG